MDPEVVALVVAAVLLLVVIVVALAVRSRRAGGVLVAGSAEGRREEELLDATTLLAGSALVGSPVVSASSGERIAQVKDVVYSPADGQVEGFTLNPPSRWRGPMREVLPVARVGEVGPDAVVVESAASLAAPAEAPGVLTAIGSERNVLGSRVITETGRELGEVVDVVVKTGARPVAVGYEVQRREGGRHRFIPLSEQRGVSGEALIVPADVETFLRDDLVGPGSAVRPLRGRRRSTK